jgi:hypothetical protein
MQTNHSADTVTITITPNDRGNPPANSRMPSCTSPAATSTASSSSASQSGNAATATAAPSHSQLASTQRLANDGRSRCCDPSWTPTRLRDLVLQAYAEHQQTAVNAK